MRPQRPVLLFSKNSTANRRRDGRLPMSHVNAALTPQHRLLHVDVKKIGIIPDGGGWRYVGRPQGQKNRAATQQTEE